MRNGTAPARRLTILASAWLLAGSALADADAGSIKTLKGTVSVERAGQPVPAKVGTRIMANDRIVTGVESSVGVTLRDNTLLTAGPNSTLELKRFIFDSTTHAGAVDATLKRGTLKVVSGKIAKTSPEAVVFRTPSLSLGVRGTEFIVDAGEGDH